MTRTTRRTFLKTGLTATAAATLGASAAAQDAARPNILLIAVDDLGYGDLGCYGGADLRTPNINGLAASGMRFTHGYANCPVCSPTRASLLTGRYPDLVGVPGVIRTHRDNSWGRLSPDATLLPAILNEAGYRTGMVGKWHLGLDAPDRPTDRGFQHFHGFLGDMMDDYYTHRRHDINYMRLGTETIDPEGHATDLFTVWASDYIRENANQSEPFFLYLAYNAPHTPVQPPEEWVDRVRAREPQMDKDRAKLVALIEHMDDGIGRVLQSLEDTGVADNTLIIFVSDNGGYLKVGASNGPLRDGKQDMYEGGIRVPLIAKWPGRIAPGAEVSDVALTMDIFATIADVAGARVDHEIDGMSFLGVLEGESTLPTDRTLIWVRREGGPVYGGLAYYAARHGRYKLLQNTPFEPYELYDLESDPKESQPLGAEHAAYKTLFQAIQDHVNESGLIPWQREA